MLKILFIYKEEDPIDPMQIELLSALAKREGHETFLNILQHKDLVADLERIKPDVVASSGKTGEHNTFLKVNRFIKETYGDTIFTIMGGPHPTFNHSGMQLHGETDHEFQVFREKLALARDRSKHHLIQRHVVAEKSGLDALCIGEGEDAWVELLRALDQKGSIDSIPNIVTPTNRKVRPVPEFRARRTFLDDLPFFDREIVYDKTFLAHFPMRSFMASRGCPFCCTYCFNFDWNQLYQRAGKLQKIHNRYTVDRLIAEVKHWMEIERKKGYAPTQFIKFYDDMFEFRVSPWLVEFAEKFPKEVGIPFSCLVRCDIFAKEQPDGSIKENEEVLLLLKKAGMRSINMSIEAGNNFIRENIFVRNMTEKEIRAAFAMMKRHKIGIFANTILGIPAPVIPRRDDPDFVPNLIRSIDQTEKAFTVARKQVGRIGGTKFPSQLDDIMKKLKDGSATEDHFHQALRLLESMGLRYDPIDYDIESVELAVQTGVQQSLFPRLEPYPGTVVTDYTVAIGAFDGNFEKMHSSCLSTSLFTCYTPRQRKIQDNLSFLGQVCAVWPWLWPFAKKHLIYWPLTRLYWALFVLMKAYVVNKYIYPMKFDLRSFVKSAYRIGMFEIKQFFQSKADTEFYRKPAKSLSATASPAGVLGGRWEK
ncbi:MAG: cobalamin-dependent protein [Candidatus Omnitrophota bacterium]